MVAVSIFLHCHVFIFFDIALFILGIFLTFVATPDVPIAHIAANVMQRNGNPAIVTISTDQMFSVNRWINNGINDFLYLDFRMQTKEMVLSSNL